MQAAPPDYPLAIRLAHWLNVVALVALVMSGLQIFNAHPALYAADDSDARRTVFTLPAPAIGDDGRMHGEMVLLGRVIDTGSFTLSDFPRAVTLGGWLEGGRRIHLALAWLFLLNGLLYLGVMLARRRHRAVWPRLADLAAVPAALRDHLRLPLRLEGPAGSLNPLQKIAYFAVPVLLGPLLVVTGLALSPAWGALFPWWTDMLGGRQFARTWHFVAMLGVLGFIPLHLLLVALAGPRTWARMVTGGPARPRPEDSHERK